MTEANTKMVFKVVGVVQVLFSLFMLCITILAIVAVLSLVGGDSLIESAGVTNNVDLSPSVVIVGTLVSLASTVLYAVSAYGFFQMKKWQPVLFSVVVVLSFFEMGMNLVNNGLQLMSLISLLFVFIWGGLLIFTWMNKKYFTK